VEPAVAEGRGISPGGCLKLLGFCFFETYVGLFCPSIMKMWSQYLPEESRSTIMNLFRIPLNIFVCIALKEKDQYVINALTTIFDYFVLQLKFCFLQPV
jgi:hypothetical protein